MKKPKIEPKIIQATPEESEQIVILKLKTGFDSQNKNTTSVSSKASKTSTIQSSKTFFIPASTRVH